MDSYELKNGFVRIPIEDGCAFSIGDEITVKEEWIPSKNGTSHRQEWREYFKALEQECPTSNNAKHLGDAMDSLVKWNSAETDPEPRTMEITAIDVKRVTERPRFPFAPLVADSFYWILSVAQTWRR